LIQVETEHSAYKEEVEGRMTVFYVETYMVKPEKQSEFMPLWKKFLKFAKENPKMFKFKSGKIFTQMIGGVYGTYVSMFEYDSLADLEKEMEVTMKDERLLKMMQEWMPFMVPNTYTTSIWNFVMNV
jgi:hypothetical protein